MKAEEKSGTAAPAQLYQLFRLTRLHKFPLGNLLIFWPYAWGIAMAACSLPSPIYAVVKHTVIFLIAATLFHSAFCVWNDMCDRDLDGQVERTRDRPLVTGAVSLVEAFALFLVLLGLTFFFVSLTNRTASWYMVSSLPINFLYPLMKRWTWWPQFWLGISCSWGCLVAWASMTDNTFTPHHVLPLQLLAMCVVPWVIMFDTMYGAQDRKDDEKMGIRSTARLFGSHIHGIATLLGTVFVAFSTLAGLSNGNDVPYFLVGCCGAALHVAWQLSWWNPDDVESCAKAFTANHYTGAIVFAGMLMDYWLS